MSVILCDHYYAEIGKTIRKKKKGKQKTASTLDILPS